MLQTRQNRNAAGYPAPREADWIARDFRFNTGQVMSEVRLHYRTIGDPSGEPVLILHGTTGTGGSMLTPDFAGELFGPGQPLDANKYFIILPDALVVNRHPRFRAMIGLRDSPWRPYRLMGRELLALTM